MARMIVLRSQLSNRPASQVSTVASGISDQVAQDVVTILISARKSRYGTKLLGFAWRYGFPDQFDTSDQRDALKKSLQNPEVCYFVREAVRYYMRNTPTLFWQSEKSLSQAEIAVVDQELSKKIPWRLGLKNTARLYAFGMR